MNWGGKFWKFSGFWWKVPLEARRANRVVRPAFWRKKTHINEQRSMRRYSYIPSFLSNSLWPRSYSRLKCPRDAQTSEKSKIRTAKCTESAQTQSCCQKCDSTSIIMLGYVNNSLLSRYSSQSEVVLWEEFFNHFNLTISKHHCLSVQLKTKWSKPEPQAPLKKKIQKWKDQLKLSDQNGNSKTRRNQKTQKWKNHLKQGDEN